MVNVIVNSLFQQGVVEQAVSAFFKSTREQQRLFLERARALLKPQARPSRTQTPFKTSSAHSSGFELTAVQQGAPPPPIDSEDQSVGSSGVLSPTAARKTPPHVTTEQVEVALQQVKAQRPEPAVELDRDLSSLLSLLSIFVTTMRTRTEQVIWHVRRQQAMGESEQDSDVLLRLCHRLILR